MLLKWENISGNDRGIASVASKEEAKRRVLNMKNKVTATLDHFDIFLEWDEKAKDFKEAEK